MRVLEQWKGLVYCHTPIKSKNKNIFFPILYYSFMISQHINVGHRVKYLSSQANNACNLTFLNSMFDQQVMPLVALYSCDEYPIVTHQGDIFQFFYNYFKFSFLGT